MKTVALVDDDFTFRRGLATALIEAGFQVLETDDGPSLECLLETASPDLIILDVMLPGQNGVEICCGLRTLGVRTPVILISALRIAEPDRVTGLNVGADDYLVKPFGVPELIARVHACLRRSAGAQSELTFGGIVINRETRTILRNGERIPLTGLEFAILAHLATRSPAVVSRDELIRNVWKAPTSLSTRTMDTHILHLRQKLEADPANPQHLISEHGVGYSLI